MPQPLHRRARARRRRVAAAGGAALLLALAPAAAQAEGWIPGPQFDLAFPAQRSAVAVAPDGAAQAVWIQGGRDGTRAAFQHAGADGATGPVHTLPQAVTSAAPDVAVGPGGGAAVWVRYPGGPTDQLQLTLLEPDGTPRETIELDGSFAAGGRDPVVAVAPDGGALAVWIELDGIQQVVKTMRVAADGTAGAEADLGPARGGLDAALAPGGTGWVTWTDGTGAQQVARVAPGGMVDAVGALPVANEIASPSLVASAAGAVFTGVSSGAAEVQGVRLAARAALTGSTFTASGSADARFGASALLADDGTVTLAWTEQDLVGAPLYAARWSRIAPGAAGGPAQAVAPEQTGWGSALPRLAPAADGSLLATWVEGDSAAGGPLAARRIGADGTLGIALRTGLHVSLVPSATAAPQRLVSLGATPASGLAAVVDPYAVGASAVTTAALDATPPQATAQLPGSGRPGEELAFAATASDRAGVSYWWDFGDGSGARTASARHAYALPGSYAVTFTATDGAGNATTIAGTVTVALPPSPIVLPPPPPAPGPIPPPPPPPVRRAAADLRLTSAVRSGASVTVAGTIASIATGRVALTYAQRSGRRTLTARATATHARGRFRATIRLPRALAKTFRLRATVTASYAGDAATDPAETVRTVSVRAARRGRARGVRSRPGPRTGPAARSRP